MRLSTSDKLFDIKAKDLRDFFRFRPDNFSDEIFCERLKITPKQADKILENMINDKIISLMEVHESDDGVKFYKILTKGHAIKNVRFTKPITKEKADKMIKELIERIKILNSDDYHLSKVEELYAFGSYITDSKDYGDIDLAFDLKRKRKHSTKEYTKLCYERQRKGGFRNLSDLYSFPFFEEPLRFLKKQIPQLSFHSIEDAKQVTKNFKLIWKIET